MLELHHIVAFKDLSSKKNPLGTDGGGGVYTIDFSPLDQSNIVTLLKMLLGQNVPGERSF